MKVGHDDEEDEEEDEVSFEYPVVNLEWLLSFVLWPMPAPLLYTIRWKCATLTACGKQQHGPRVTDGGHEGHVGVLRDVAAVAVWGLLWYLRGGI